MAYEPRRCPRCGDALDPGEICDCATASGGERSAEEAALREARRTAQGAKVSIMLAKDPGTMTVRRRIEASSREAAVLGVSSLVEELAAMLGINSVEALSLVAATLIPMQSMGKGGEG